MILSRQTIFPENSNVRLSLNVKRAMTLVFFSFDINSLSVKFPAVQQKNKYTKEKPSVILRHHRLFSATFYSLLF